MNINCLTILFLTLILIGPLPLWGQNNPAQQPIISADQIASSFGYSGTLKVQDFASLGLTKPDVLQELNFTSDDSTFLPTNVTVMTAGTLLTPQALAAFEKATASSPPPPNFKAVTLSDGTTAYLLSMGGPGGAGYEARMTSKDGRFDLAVSLTVQADVNYQPNASNRDYYERMFGNKNDPLAELATALPQIYSAIASNYERVLAQKASTNTSSPNQTQTTNGSPSQFSISSGAAVPLASPAQTNSIPSTQSGIPKWIFGIIILGLIVGLWYFWKSKK